MSSFLVDAVLRLFSLIGGLHSGRNCANFDFLQWCGEIRIEGE